MALITPITGFVTNPMTEDLDCNSQIVNDLATFKTAVLQTNRLDTVFGSPAIQIDLDDSLRVAATKSVDFTGVGEIERGIAGHIRLINLPTTASPATTLLGYNTVTKEVESSGIGLPTDWSTFPATQDPEINNRSITNLRNITGNVINYQFNGASVVENTSFRYISGTSEIAIGTPNFNSMLIKSPALVINGLLTGANLPVTGWFLTCDTNANWLWRDPGGITLGNANYGENVTGAVNNALAYQTGNDVTGWLSPPTPNNCFLRFNQDTAPDRLEWSLPPITQFRTSKMFPNNVLENPFGDLAQGGGFLPSLLQYYDCAVTHPNGYVYSIPYSAYRISRLNPETGVSDNPGTYFDSSSVKYSCAITATDMKIYAPPNNITDWLIFDPYDNTDVLHPSATNGFVCVSQVGNFLYALSTDGVTASEIYKLNITTLAETLVASVAGSYWGCCIGVDGRIYYAPYQSSDILVLDPTTDTTSTIATGLTPIAGMYKSVCLSASGSLYFAPFNEAQIMKLTSAGVVSFLGAFGGTGSEKFSGITLSTNNVLFLCPYGYDELVLWNPTTDTQITTFSANLSGLNTAFGTEKWSQLLLLQNGSQLMLVPFAIDIGGVNVPRTRTLKSGQPTIPPWMLSMNLNKD